MNLEKVKEAARRFEQKEDWRRAIEVYQRALDEEQGQREQAVDPSVYNRVGDLHLKVGETHAAVNAYERALDAYADQGFINNAIALGGKILRVDPGRTPAHLRLAQLHARKNVGTEVRRHLTDYIQRMQRARQLPVAVTALREFVERDCRDADMRSGVIDLVGHMVTGDSESGELAALLTDLQGMAEGAADAGETASSTRGLIFLDTDGGFSRDATAGAAESAGEVTPVEGLNTVDATLPQAVHGLPLIGLETTEFSGSEAMEVEHVTGMEVEQSSFGDGGLGVDVEGQPEDPMEGVAAGGSIVEGLTPTVLEPSPEAAAIGEIEIEIFDSMDSEDLLIEVPKDPDFITLDDDLAPLDLPVEPAPEDRHAAPDTPSPVEVEEGRLAVCAEVEDWVGALDAAAALVRLEPDVIPRYQKQVELAYRAGDRAILTARYLELGDALLRAGMRAPAVAVYQRVLEHDAGDGRALGALASLGVSVRPLPDPPPAEPEATGDFVDLGALILGDAPVRDSRMKVDAGEPAEPENEDETFRDILEQFKRGIEENIDTEDFQAHYDLGIAFKEMGLLDEAIAQFQRALRSPEGRLRASEALGIAFHEKGRYAIAEAVLARAIEGLPGEDDAKIGLIYWLGRALESQGRDPEALVWYERALAVDIRFLDLGDRVQRLAAGGRP